MRGNDRTNLFGSLGFKDDLFLDLFVCSQFVLCYYVFFYKFFFLKICFHLHFWMHLNLTSQIASLCLLHLIYLSYLCFFFFANKKISGVIYFNYKTTVLYQLRVVFLCFAQFCREDDDRHRMKYCKLNTNYPSSVANLLANKLAMQRQQI